MAPFSDKLINPFSSKKITDSCRNVTSQKPSMSGRANSINFQQALHGITLTNS